MNKNDLDKLAKAGYTFIRSDKRQLAIKTQSHGTYSHGWRILESGFSSFKAVERRMEELLKDEKTLEV